MQISVNTKVLISDFIIKSLFKTVQEGIVQATDKLVVRNCQLHDKQGVGYNVDGHNFIHSSCNFNLSFMQMCRSDLLPPAEEIVEPSLQLLETIENQDIDRMRFKGLVNGLLSLCRNEDDIGVIFDGLFSKELEAFNQQFQRSFPLNMEQATKKATVGEMELQRAAEIKQQFDEQYKRYRFLTEVLGV